MPYRDDDHDILDPREFPEPEHDADAPLPCPHCMGVLHELAVRCPHCGNWLSDEDALHRKPWWVMVGLFVCLAMAVYWIFAG